MTSPYAEVIGDPIGHSRSPTIHRFWLEKLGIAGRYDATQVTAESLGEYLEARRGDPLWRGCNVSMPLKAAALAAADISDAAAQRVGAANLLTVQPDGRLLARNEDIRGVAEPLAAIGADPGALVQIIGAGGAARAAAIGAKQAGFGRFEIFNRDRGHAEALAELTSPATKIAPLDDIGPSGDGPVILINATPLGMVGRPDVPVNPGDYPADSIVFDMVYAPLETRLLHLARAHGLRVIDGLHMLVAQAAPSFEALFGAPAPRRYDHALRALLQA